MPKKMNLLDAGFVLLETKESPQHAAGLLVFELPENATDDYLPELYEKLRGYPVNASPFNNCLDRSLRKRLAPEMTELAPNQIDIDYHLRNSALPRPGGELELGVLVSRLYSIPMDLSKPLWELHIIQGLADNRFALFLKMHHSLVDGTAGIKMLSDWLSESADINDFVPIWARKESAKPKKIERARPERLSLTERLSSVFNGAATVVPELVSAISESVSSTKERKTGGLVAPYVVPKTILNQPITGRRRVSTQIIDIDRVKALSTKLDQTLNDTVLGLVSGALRRYLSELDSLPEQESLVAGVLANLRAKDDPNPTGNSIGLIFADLATDEADPVKRAKRIHGSMEHGKAHMRRMSGLGRAIYSGLVSGPGNMLAIMGLSESIPPSHSLFVTNVPGPKKPMYFGGAKLKELYPFTIILHGQALLVGVVSLPDKMCFSVVACPDSLPSSQRLAVLLPEVLLELEAAVNLADKPAPKKVAAKRKVAAKKKVAVKKVVD